MSLSALLLSPVVSHAAASPVQRRLAAGQALSLQPDADVRVQVARGRLWLTLDGPGAGALPGLGDWFLSAGQAFVVPAGRRAVIEPWLQGDDAEAHFSIECVDRSALNALKRGRRLLARLQPGTAASNAGWSGRLGCACMDGR